MISVRDIVLEKIDAAGADGLCNPEIGCACLKGWLFTDCNVQLMEVKEQALFADCVLARQVHKLDVCKNRNCKKCLEDCEGYPEVQPDDNVYVPLEIENEKDK